MLKQTSTLVAAALISCHPRPANPELEPPVASSWPEADRLFQQDPGWRGGDGAFSIDLGAGRVLWLFGDSWIDPGASGSRAGAVMVSNSLAIQEGYDPSQAIASFYWGTTADGSPRAFFTDTDEGRYWPGNGVVVDGRLVIFLMRVLDVDRGLGFEVSDWRAVLIRNPWQDPPDWEVEWLPTPAARDGIILGSGGVLYEGGYLYAFGAQEPGHAVYLARWSAADVIAGRMARVEWWSGVERGWSAPGNASPSPQPVFEDGQTEFTVHPSEASGSYVEYQTLGFGVASIVRRKAPDLGGPWSAPDTVFTPPEASHPGIMIYQGKAHPHLRGAGLVLTYCTNSADFEDHLSEPWLYFPRFVRLVSR